MAGIPTAVPSDVSSQNTKNVSVCDSYQENTHLSPTHFQGNYQPNKYFKSSNHHQSYFSKGNTSLPQYKSSSKEDNLNIQNLSNMQLKTKGVFINKLI